MRIPKVREQAPKGMREVWATDYRTEDGKIQITMITVHQMPEFVDLEVAPPITDGSKS